MNIIDLLILLIMSIYTVVGSYNGSVVSAFNAASFILSWLISLIFYPLVRNLILAKIPNLFTLIKFYSDGSSRISNIESRAMPVSHFTEESISQIVNESQTPNPFRRVLSSAFNKAGTGQTLAEYFDATIATVIINIVSLLLLFLFIRLLIVIAVSIFKTVKEVPVLKKYDGLVGSGIGVLRGILVANFVFALVPILTTIAPIEFITTLIEDSLLGNLFYKVNIFTLFIR
ncbi:MAG TPA: hypothetical protein VFD33_03295 [Bacillota bacterium]|nr:hypothetical protein [Bacillota bacterium]